MGVIQSSINNLLATATIAAKLTPGLEEYTTAKNAFKVASETTQWANKEAEKTDPKDRAKLALIDEMAIEAGDKAVESAKELALHGSGFESTEQAANRYVGAVQRQEENIEHAASKHYAQISAKAQEMLGLRQNEVRKSENFRGGIQ
jgi:hypothetical protein